jgi:FMN phosphatase YigB (HAD superfamily)
MIKDIRHIIFDLGGVILNLDYELTEKAFVEAGITNFRDLYSQLAQSSLFDEWETGKIHREEFITALQKISGIGLSEEQVLKAWNAMLLDFPLRRLQLLQQLRLHYDMVLLSNTNEVHETALNNILMRDHGIPSVGVFFDKVYFSHRVGLRKPSREIFQMVLDETGFKPEHTLFIDDSPQHIETAGNMGIRTILMERGMTIENNIFLPKG